MNFLILILISLIITAIGFKKYVYFISLGYGFSIAAMGVVLAFVFNANLTAVTVLACIMFVVYGFRLSGYLLLREIKSSSYRAAMQKEIKDGSDIKLAAKISIWISVAVLYPLMVSPVFFRLQNGGGSDWLCVLGVAVMILGVVSESVADLQKSAAKKQNPRRFCDKGLYKIVRCPNYLGEITFWTGVLISGLGSLNGWLQWLSAFIGWAAIVYIMFGGARRLEIRQNKNYGNNPEYKAYVKKTPIILPFVPLYSVEKFKWLKG